MVDRTLSFRNAVSLTDFGARDGGPGSLHELLNAVHAIFETVPERTCRFDGKIVELRNHRVVGDILLLHFVAYTENDPVAIVPAADDVVGAPLALHEAPDDAEFLDGEVMALVCGNDVGICRSGLAEAAIYQYTDQLWRRSELGPTAHSAFRLMKRADIDMLEKVRRVGVSSLGIKAIAHDVSVDRIEREAVSQKVTGAVFDQVKALLGLEADIPDDAENLKVEVALKFDKRKGGELEGQRLQDLAEAMINDDDEGFDIKLNDGTTLRQEQVVLSKSVSFQPYGKSIGHVEAWGALREYYEELRA